MHLSQDRDVRYAVAVDLGATHLRCTLVSSAGIEGETISTTTPRSGQSGAVITRAICSIISECMKNNGLKNPVAIGVSSAGPLDLSEGKILNSPNMAFSEVPLIKPLKETFGLPVTIMNDGQAGAYGEYTHGAGRGIPNIVYITLSTGIGGGALVDGHLLIGRDGNAVEIGHIFVDTQYSLSCRCGGFGHWEAYASGENLPSFCKAWCSSKGYSYIPENMKKTETIFSEIEKGKPVLIEFLDALGRINARGVSSLIVSYAPERIIFDGPIARSHWPLILSSMEPYIECYLPSPELVLTPLEGKAPLIGAGIWALRHAEI